MPWPGSPSPADKTVPWIRVIGLEEATGFLKAQYDAAVKRAGCATRELLACVVSRENHCRY